MIDQTMSILSNKYRRRLLFSLLDNSSEDGLPIPEAVHTGEQRLEVLQTELVHTHLPKMGSTDVIRWDRETNTVSKGPAFEELRPLLELLDEHAEELPGTVK